MKIAFNTFCYLDDPNHREGNLDCVVINRPQNVTSYYGQCCEYDKCHHNETPITMRPYEIKPSHPDIKISTN